MEKRFGLTVWYGGDLDPALDTEIKTLAKLGLWWAQGYDFGEKVRDIAFDFHTALERAQAVSKLEKIQGVSWRCSNEC